MSGNKGIIKNRFYVLIVLSVTAIILFASTIGYEFYFDDYFNIVENSDIAMTSLAPGALKRAATTEISGLRPVPYLTFALNHYAAGGFSPAPFRVVNIIIHILNAFLIYLIILNLFSYGNSSDEEKSRISISAFFTAALWLTTPLNSTPVIYIVQRMVLLMTLFALLAFLMYIKGRRSNSPKHFILAGIFFILSIMSKQNAATLPLAIIAYELVFVKRGEIKSITKGEKLLLAGLSAIMLLAALIYGSRVYESVQKGYMVRDFTMYERLLTQPRVLVHYLSLMILPLPGRLSLTYDIAVSTSLFTPVTTLLSIFAITALLVVAIKWAKRAPYFSFAVFWFFIGLLVESTFIPLELVYEHRMYFPGIFLIGAGVDFLVRKLHANNKRPLIAALVILSITFSAMTIVRGNAWESDVTLWQDVLSKYPDDPRAQCNLGTAYKLAGRYNEAEDYLSRGVEAWSKTKTNRLNLAGAYENLGITQLQLGKLNEAEKSFLRGLEYNDDSASLHSNLGMVSVKRGDYSVALEYFLNAAKYEAGNPSHYLNAGNAYYILKRYDDALKYYEISLKMNPGNSALCVAIAGVYKDKSDYKKAAEYLNRALKINPNNVSARKNLSFIQGLLSRGRE